MISWLLSLSYTSGRSPELFPLIGDHVDCSYAGIDENVEYVLRVVASLVGLSCINRLDIIENAFDEKLVRLRSLPN